MNAFFLQSWWLLYTSFTFPTGTSFLLNLKQHLTGDAFNCGPTAKMKENWWRWFKMSVTSKIRNIKILGRATSRMNNRDCSRIAWQQQWVSSSSRVTAKQRVFMIRQRWWGWGWEGWGWLSSVFVLTALKIFPWRLPYKHKFCGNESSVIQRLSDQMYLYVINVRKLNMVMWAVTQSTRDKDNIFSTDHTYMQIA